MISVDGKQKYTAADVEVKTDGFSCDVEMDRNDNSTYFFLELIDPQSTDTGSNKKVWISPKKTTAVSGIKDTAVELDFKLVSGGRYLAGEIGWCAIYLALFVLTLFVGTTRKARRILYFVGNLFFLPLITDIATKTVRTYPENGGCILLASIIVICLCVSLYRAKHLFRNWAYVVVVAFFSTFILLDLTQVFTGFYQSRFTELTWQEISTNWNNRHGSSLMWTWDGIVNGLYAFRYYFEFPDSMMYCTVSIYQFLIGKLYEMTILAAVAGGIGRSLIRQKK